MKVIYLNPIKVESLVVHIRGISPMIQHKWSERAIGAIRDKHAGKKTKNRQVRYVDDEGQASAYVTASGEYGVPAGAFKKCLINAAHKDLGIEKTLVKKSIFIKCNDKNNVIPFTTFGERLIREDPVRVGMGSADLHYRMEFRDWEIDVPIDFDGELLQAETIVNLMNRAGFGVGLMEWRPINGGEYGRFEVEEEKVND